MNKEFGVCSRMDKAMYNRQNTKLTGQYCGHGSDITKKLPKLSNDGKYETELSDYFSEYKWEDFTVKLLTTILVSQE